MFTQRKHDATLTEVQCEIVSPNLVALFQGLPTVHLLLSCSPRPSHHPVFDCLQNHLQYQGVLFTILYKTKHCTVRRHAGVKVLYTSVSHGRPMRLQFTHACTGHSCLFSAWLTIDAVNYVVKLFLFVPNEKHTLINLVWSN